MDNTDFANQMSMFDFQPYYREWCRVTGRTTREPYPTHEYINWITMKHRMFRMVSGWPDNCSGLKPYQTEFIEWLKEQYE